MAFDLDSLAIVGGGNAVIENKSTTGNELTFTIKPDPANPTGTYVVTYETFDDVVDKGYRVENKAEIVGTEYNDTSGLNVPQGILSKTGSNLKTINYKDKTINWAITFNSRGYTGIENVVFTDTFEAGKFLKLYEDDFTTLPDNFRLELTDPQTDNDGKYTLTGFTLKADPGHKVNGPVKVEYKTHFDPTTKYEGNNVKNTVGVTWELGGKKYDNPAEHTANFNDFTKDNGAKNGTYNPSTKTIDWTVDVNYNLFTLANAKVVDNFENKQTMTQDQIDAIKVYKLTMSDNNQDPDPDSALYTKVNIKGKGDLEGKGFTGFEVEFLEEITEPYRIVYTTEFNKQFISDARVWNTATLLNDTTEISTLPKYIEILNAGEYLSKEGKDIANEDYLEWTLKVNESQSYIAAGSIITDTLNDGQVLVQDFNGIELGYPNDRGTFVVQKYIYAPGETEPTYENVDAADIFEFKTVDEGKGFTATLKADINEAYKIIYVADISLSTKQDLSNSYEYNFQGNESETGSKTEFERVTYEFSGAGANLRFYELKLNKKDSADQAPINAVEFELYHKGKVIQTKSTDANGDIDFGQIKYGDYILKEKTPKGYVPELEVEGKGTHLQEYRFQAADHNNINIDLNIKNTKRNQTVEITNKSCNGPIEGAELVLYKKDGNDYKPYKGTEENSTVTTGADGKITFGIDEEGKSELPEGEYKVEQKKVPEGVKPFDGPEKTFKIEENQTEKVVIEFENDCNYCPNFELEVTGATDGQTVVLKVPAKEVGQGTKYELGTTDVTGKVISSTPVPHGTYQVIVDGLYIGEVTVDDNCEAIIAVPTNACEVTFINKEGTDDVTASSEYKIVDKNGNVVVEKVTSDTDGKIVVPKLPNGDYTLIQTKVPTGYLPSADIDFKVTDNCGATIKDVIVTPTDACPIFELKIQTANGQGRPDIEVTVKDAEGNNIKNEAIGTEITTVTTDTNGVVTFDYAIKPGTYEVFEGTKSLGKFTVEDECSAIVKPKSSGGGGGGTPTPACENFVVTVKDASGKPHADAVVTLKNEAGNVYTQTTNANGEISLPYATTISGPYTVYEGTTVLGSITVDYTDGNCKDEVIVPVLNACTDFTITVKESGKVVEAGTSITLKDAAGKTAATGTTDKAGKIVFAKDKLVAGTYTAFDKDGKEVGKIVVSYDEGKCQDEIDLLVKSCDAFTITVKESGKVVEAGTSLTLKDASGKTTATGTTDKDGKIVFEKDKLAEGTYTAFDKDGKEVGTIVVSYDKDKCQDEIDLVVKACDSYTLTVVDTPNTLVELKDSKGNTIATGTTDSNGKVIFTEPIPEGNYEVFIDGKKVADLSVEDSCEGIVTPDKGGGTNPPNPGDEDSGVSPPDSGVDNNVNVNPPAGGDGGVKSEGAGNGGAGASASASASANPPGSNNAGDKPGSGNANNAGKLPQTGEEQFMYMIALGALFLAAGGIVLFRQRRRA